MGKRTVREELLLIKGKNGGTIAPERVVEYARNPKTALHKRFQWDDTLAAEQYRLWQARHIISLELIVLDESRDGKPVRAFISLSQDRPGGGYRGISEIMMDAELRDQLLEEAKQDMLIFKRKYGALAALAKVFEAMDSV